MTILIENLEFKTIIGLLKHERNLPQKVIINAKIKSNSFVDYAKICSSIEKTYKKHSFKTVEDSLKKTTKILKKKNKKIYKIYIKIIKPNIIDNAHVGASLRKKY